MEAYNLEKTVQAISYVASKIPEISVIDTLRLLFISDKSHMLQFGRTITGDTAVVTEYGFMPDKTMYEIDKYFTNNDYVKKHYSLDDTKITSKHVDRKKFSDSDIMIIDKAIENISCIDNSAEKFDNGDIIQYDYFFEDLESDGFMRFEAMNR